MFFDRRGNGLDLPVVCSPMELTSLPLSQIVARRTLSFPRPPPRSRLPRRPPPSRASPADPQKSRQERMNK